MPFDPTITFQGLLDAETDQDQIKTFIITSLGQGTDGGFPVTNWPARGVALKVIEADAAVIARTNENIADIARSAFVTTSEGDWLSLAAFDQYSLERLPAVAGRYRVRLSCVAGSGPYTISPFGFHVRSPDGSQTYQSTNTTPAMLPSNGTLDLDFQASVPGTTPNIIDTPGISLGLITVLLGVTAMTVVAPGSTSSVVVAGSDRETDDRLRKRCITQWALLTVAAVADTFIATALAAVTDAGDHASSVFVDDLNPRGPGTVDVYVASAAGGAPSPLVAAVDAALQKRKPLGGVNVATASASEQSVTVTGTVFVTGDLTETTIAVNAAIVGLQASLQVGDRTGTGTLFRSVVEATIQNVPGVRNVDLTVPSGDITPPAGFVIKLVNSLTFTAVT